MIERHQWRPFPSLPNPPPFFRFSLSPTPFDACYAGYSKSEAIHGRHSTINYWKQMEACLTDLCFFLSDVLRMSELQKPE